MIPLMIRHDSNVAMQASGRKRSVVEEGESSFTAALPFGSKRGDRGGEGGGEKEKEKEKVLPPPPPTVLWGRTASTRFGKSTGNEAASKSDANDKADRKLLRLFQILSPALVER